MGPQPAPPIMFSYFYLFSFTLNNLIFYIEQPYPFYIHFHSSPVDSQALTKGGNNPQSHYHQLLIRDYLLYCQAVVSLGWEYYNCLDNNMYSVDFPNNVFVVERNLKSSSFYEFLPQATLCILVRVDNNLLLWHFLKTFFSFFIWKRSKVTYVMSEALTSGRKCKKLFVIWTLSLSRVTC